MTRSSNILSEEDLKYFVFAYMSTPIVTRKFLTRFGILTREGYSNLKLAEVARNESKQYSIKNVCENLRGNWEPPPVEFHIRNLLSNKLLGHSWHGSTPSFLHMSLQNHVRKHIELKSQLEELIEIGADVMKHEYFMVATHDLLEASIIKEFKNVIPAIRTKSIADFVFDGMPYDLKNTNYPRNWDVHSKDYYGLARKLIAGADSGRDRQQANQSYKALGKNRFLVINSNPDEWLVNPKLVLKKFIQKVYELKKPMVIEQPYFKTYVQLIIL